MDRFDIRDCPSVPWKNGGGHTRTLVQDTGPNGHLLWRLSLADIDQSGPFSLFPGLRRYHVIVQGAGLTLAAQNRTIAARPLCPIAFDGETAFTATLDQGPCQAVNLMFDPCHLSVEALCLANGSWVSEASQTLVLCVSGNATLDLPDGDLATGQGVLISGPVRVEAAPGVMLVCFGITDLPQAW